MASICRINKVTCPIMKDYPEPICYCDRVELKKKLPKKAKCNNGKICIINNYFDATQVAAFFNNNISV